MRSRKRNFSGYLLFLVAAVGGVARAQNATTTKDVEEATLQSIPVRSWIVDAAKNELEALHHTDSYLRYRTHTVSEKGDMVRDVVESKDGTVARLIMKDGKPLTEEQDQGERQRLNDMIASPSAYFRHVRNGESDRKMADKLVPLMPDAMIYTYTPGQPQSGKNGGAPEVVIDYKPNPKFSPPSTEAQALTGLEGRVWIDARSHTLVRMEGTISRGVNFGWGMLAHIYPGGKLELDQTSVGENRWIFTYFSMKLSVRALMLKTVNVHTESTASSFQKLGPMSYQDAIRMMLATPLPER
ncbi:hypothetical protein [Tunturibacter empetritectus]|uniref:MucB/RseB N-terminal domain-containing protein n=1 Tax=Tunturiibacter lichenicola TaxID=2051959 RepID=A0A7W8JA47_9BACT|nr:hypothetical protein [Edaphobacter lichenicola]MBB5344144.1 hypothetical protein [Edaphobacter lichenicola]